MVYLIGDDESLSSALGRLLEANGLCCDACNTDENFKDRISGDDAECFLVDLEARSEPGLLAVDRLTRQFPGVPKILLGVRDNAEERDRAREHRAAAYFSKPVDGKALVDTVSYVCNA